MKRREILRGIAAAALMKSSAWAIPANGERLAAAARAQIGVTTGYDPSWTSISYPNGDVPRWTGVCADVIIRAARDAFGLDLQKLVHEDMVRHFDAYHATAQLGIAATGHEHRSPPRVEPGDVFPALRCMPVAR